MEVISWNQSGESHLSQMRSIFFANSNKKSFESKKEKEEFFDKWVGYYLRHWPEETFLVQNQQGQIIAYLTGCSDSSIAFSQLKARIPSLEAFESWYGSYPAHLHINTHPNYRGRGIGSKLIQAYLRYLNDKSIYGVHIVTSPDADNVDFYKKNGFASLECVRWNKTSLLQLMGLQFH